MQSKYSVFAASLETSSLSLKPRSCLLSATTACQMPLRAVRSLLATSPPPEQEQWLRNTGEQDLAKRRRLDFVCVDRQQFIKKFPPTKFHLLINQLCQEHIGIWRSLVVVDDR